MMVFVKFVLLYLCIPRSACFSVRNVATSSLLNMQSLSFQPVVKSISSIRSSLRKVHPLITTAGATLLGGQLIARELTAPIPPITSYDAQAIERYHKQTPLLSLKRVAHIAACMMRFAFKTLLGIIANDDKQAARIVTLVSNLGPTFIKIGQALSIRPDLVSPTYINALKKLQDAVPPFGTVEAQKIICKELNITTLSDRFKKFSPEPVAAASIGQVYRATLLDGQEVAVKVQRPTVAATILLDLYLLRLLAPWQVRFTNLLQGGATTDSDIQQAYGLVDEWGKGLVAELDYVREAGNAAAFSRAMRERGLGAVMAPRVLGELSTGRVLVTEWVEGTRLDRIQSKEATRLCGTAINAYLTMLLDTGVLHCDPHPGNLLRTEDGRLCVLDWGMTLSLPSDLRHSLLEFIAHCSAQDFAQLPEDFVKLGATPADKAEEVRTSGIPEGFAYIMQQLGEGGGITQLTNQLRVEFQARYGNMSDAELSLHCRKGIMHSELALSEGFTAPAIVSDSSAGAVKRGAMEFAAGTGVQPDLHRVENRQTQSPRRGMAIGITGVLEMMSKRNRDIFQFPAYMLYIARAFATLEGIGLAQDPHFSILRECGPYLARRLLTDESPRTRQVLQRLLYKDGKLNTGRVAEMVRSLRSFTASTTMATATANSGRGESTGEISQQPVLQDELVDLVLNSNNTLLQEVVVDCAAQLGEVWAVEALGALRNTSVGRAALTAFYAPRTVSKRILPKGLRKMAAPMQAPYTAVEAMGTALLQKVDDSQDVHALQDLLHAVRVGAGMPSAATLKPKSRLERLQRVPLVIADATKTIQHRRIIVPRVAKLAGRAGTKMLRRSARRLTYGSPAPLPKNPEPSTWNEEVRLLADEAVAMVASLIGRTAERLLVTDNAVEAE